MFLNMKMLQTLQFVWWTLSEWSNQHGTLVQPIGAQVPCDSARINSGAIFLRGGAGRAAIPVFNAQVSDGT
jgi:hypothetical protein